MIAKTWTGHVAHVRHLKLDLHIETDYKVAKSLLPFLSKIHFIAISQVGEEKEEIMSEAKASKGKMLFFENLDSFYTKIMPK